MDEHDDEIILLLVGQLLNSMKLTNNRRLIYFRKLLQRRRFMNLHNKSNMVPIYAELINHLGFRAASEKRHWALPRPQMWFSNLMERRDLDYW